MTKEAKLILFSCLYILGIITFFVDKVVFLSLILFAAVIIASYKNYISAKTGLIFCLIFLTGIVNSMSHIKYFDDLSSFDDTTITVKAKVLNIPSNAEEDKTKFFASVTSLSSDDMLKENVCAKTLVTITDKKENISKIKIGDTVLLTGKLKVPYSAQNPSQFDYARYLQFKNTFSLLYVQQDWAILCGADNLTGKILSRLNDTRTKILKIHAQNIKTPMIEILGGIIFGDDAVNPDNDTKSSFINSGIFHILAASGMNVTLILGIWLFFANNLKLNYRFSIITGILLILFYTCMTGFGPPIIRATLMLTMILIFKLFSRKASTLATLFLVAFLMLLFNPLMLFDIGFQLSFTVTFALILTAPLLTMEGKHKFINYTLGACLVPVIAQIFAAPFQMYYFNTFATYSILANIAIIPVLSIVSFLGFISSILAMIPLIADKICLAADFILNPLLIYIVKVANFFANMPSAIFFTKKPTLLQLLLYFAIVISLICIMRFRTVNKRILIAFSTMVLTFFMTFIPLTNHKPEILFFSVGYADAILVKSPSDKYFIVDSAKPPYKTFNSQAKNIIIKYLKDKGIKNIEAFILTSCNPEHAGGQRDLEQSLNIKTTHLPHKTEVQTIYEEPDFSIRTAGMGNKSLAVSIKYKSQSALLMGDGNIKAYSKLPVDFRENISILKTANHGARNTINNKMLKNTDIIVISTGRNFKGHPAEETLEILDKNKKPYYRTDIHNAIKAVLNGTNAEVYYYSPKMKKFVN